jgi:hypothetical protein
VRAGTLEEDFWTALEYRVCREMDKIPICRRLGLWCDGFNPQLYLLHHSPSEITGNVWIGFGRYKQEEWKFRLLLSPFSSNRMAWPDLVPQEELTGWLGVNAAKRELKLDLRREGPRPWLKCAPVPGGSDHSGATGQ